MSDEDDYMAETFLTQAETVSRPGVSTSHNHRRHLINESKRERNEFHMRSAPKKAELEKNKREEALQKPICESSKGFSLMAKMGYKPGMSLGKKKDENDMGSGIKEPIPLMLKTDRKGLGTGAVEKEEAELRVRAAMDQMLNLARNNEKLIHSYRKRKRDGSTTKQLIGDILRSRSACENLDLNANLRIPAVSWFWKSFRDRNATEKKNVVDSDDEDDITYHYSNGEPGPAEERYNEFSDDVLEERIQQITLYLQETYYYCTWCGTSYSDQEDFKQNCPGPSRDAHDDCED